MLRISSWKRCYLTSISNAANLATHENSANVNLFFFNAIFSIHFFFAALRFDGKSNVILQFDYFYLSNLLP